MTDTELLDTLAELDKMATKGPVEVCGSYRDEPPYLAAPHINTDDNVLCDLVGRINRDPPVITKSMTEATDEDWANAELWAFISTHRARLLELARKGLSCPSN